MLLTNNKFMNGLLVATCIILFSNSANAQNINKSCSTLSGSKADFKGNAVNLNFEGENKTEVLNLLKNSYYQVLGDSSKKQSFEKLAAESASKKKVQLENIILPIDSSDPNGIVQLTISFDSKLLLPNSDSFLFVFGCKEIKADTVEVFLKKEETETTTVLKDKSNSDLPFRQILFIVPDMMSTIQNGNTCNLCEIRKSTEIDSRRDRVYSTDYIVTFDPMLTKDAYTICKHIFIKKGQKIEERYRKVGAKWFAPAVGSQIRFEVVNQPLTESRRVTVDAIDIFNNGATQFQGIINSQVNTQIISRLNPSTPTPSVDTTAATKTPKANQNSSGKGSVREPTDKEKLQMLHSQLVDYISVFRLSSCTIDEHMRNLPKIIAAVNTAFGTTAAGAVSITQQLKGKFADSVNLTRLIDEIGSIFNILKDVRPLAYTTLRAKNRDYLAVKTFDGNNAEVSNENIRLSGGMKIDYSTGFVLSGLRDFNYSLKNDTASVGIGTNRRDTSGNIIIKEDDGNNNVGVGILTHFYPRLSSHYNIGGTVGLMTSTNLNLRLMLGGSFMVSSLFGSNNRVSFSYGCVWGKVARLSSQHEDFFNKPRVVNGIPEFYSQAAAPQPIQRNEKSWFFAITMNFGGN